jgi:hypothetical protein
VDAHFFFAVVVSFGRGSVPAGTESLVEDRGVGQKARQTRRKHNHEDAHGRAEAAALDFLNVLQVDVVEFVPVWLDSVFGTRASSLFAVPSHEAS